MGVVARSQAVADAAATPCAPLDVVPATDSALGRRKLVEAARRGEHQAFATVVQKNQGAVYGYLRARLLQPADVEDMCQEVFLRFYLGRKKLDRAASLRSWLIGIARNVLREHVRRLSRRREVAWTELCLELDSLTDASPSLRDEALALLPDCLEALGPSARQALDMHYRSQMKISEIAEKLCRSQGAVKLLMYRARQALKHCLDRKLEDSRDE